MWSSSSFRRAFSRHAFSRGGGGGRTKSRWTSSWQFLGNLAYFARHDFTRFVKVGCALIVFHDYVAEIAHTKGPSMYPTFNTRGDVVLVEQVSRLRRNLQPGDVVISVCPYEPKKMICKRLTALEGQRVDVRRLHGPFGQENTFIRGKDTVEVPRGHVWIQGDNLQNSTDSRYYGPVPYSLLRGRVFYKVWPPSEFGPVTSSHGGPSVPPPSATASAASL